VIKYYRWQDLKHAVGFTATCARLALEHYSGEHRAALVAAIEFAERCAAGEVIDLADANAAVRAAGAVAAAATYVTAVTVAAADAVAAAYAAADAADAAYAAYAADAADAAARAACAANCAANAGVDPAEIDALWRGAVARDLGATPGSDSYFAACAALAIGNVDLARDLAGSERSHGGDAL